MLWDCHRRCEFPSRTRCSQVDVFSLNSPNRVDTRQVGRPKFDIICYNGDSIFASTCLLELKLPNHFPKYASFDSAMRTVIEGSSFTTA